jgi:alpha-beta hydrolase superfamily lysophospholipase
MTTQISSIDSAAPDRVRIALHVWPVPHPRAVVLIAHGAAEHAARYARFAAALNAAGYGVYAVDHRGHGLTAASTGLGIFAADDGWNRAVADLRQAVDRMRNDHPGIPLVLFGHSMGSLMVQQYVAEYGDSIDAAVLCGSMLIDGLRDLLPLIAAEVAQAGREAPCNVMTEMMAGGGFTAGLEDVSTPFDWLSRDRAEVQAYIDDPLCGFPLSTGAWQDLLGSNRIPAVTADYARIPRDLPVHVIAGEKDPVNQGLTVLKELLRRYEDAGMRRVSARFYPGARHEILNEINREEVTAELIAWLDATV